MAWFSLLLLVVLVNGIENWEQVTKKSFQAIFPGISREKIWELKFQINKQNSSSDSIKILNSWLDDNWIEGNTTKALTKATLNNKEFARKQAIGFIEHRWIVKEYVRHLYRSIQNDKRKSKKDAENMRLTFWNLDLMCRNYFRCTALLFLRRIGEVLAEDNSEYAILEAKNTIIYQSSVFYDRPFMGTKLDWELTGGKMWDGLYSYKVYFGMFHYDVSAALAT